MEEQGGTNSVPVVQLLIGKSMDLKQVISGKVNDLIILIPFEEATRENISKLKLKLLSKSIKRFNLFLTGGKK